MYSLNKLLNALTVLALMLVNLVPLFAHDTVVQTNDPVIESVAQNACGKSLCDILAQVLKKNNTLNSLNEHSALMGNNPIQYQPLILSALNDFPFNITVDIPQFIEETYRTPSDIPTNATSTTLIILFSTEEVVDILQNTQGIDFLTLLIDRIAMTDKNCRVQLLFSYGDKTPLSAPNMITGSGAFLDNLLDRDDKIILRVHLLKGVRNAVDDNGSPSYLTRLATDAFFSIGRDYNFPGSYSTRIFPTNAPSNIFSESAVPSCSVTLDQNTLTATDIARFLSYVVVNFGKTHENRSLAFKVGAKTLWISEKTTTTAFLILTFLAILSVIQYTISHKASLDATKHDIFRLLYILPLTIFFVTLSFSVAQRIVLNSPLLIIAFKIFFAFCTASALFLIILKIQGTLLSVAYSYFITITAVINIFLFSSLDISLFWLFCAEYLIIFLSRFVQHTLSICIFFVLLGVPFAPYIAQIIGNPLALDVLSEASVIANILSSFVFVPFALVWLRILVRLNYKWTKSVKLSNLFMSPVVIHTNRDGSTTIDTRSLNMTARNILVFIAGLLIMAVLLFTVTRSFKDKVVASPNITYITKTADTITAKISDSTYFGETSRILKIHTTSPAIRLIVAVRGNIANPVLYSEHPYKTANALKTSYFLLPAYPGRDIAISYIANNTTPATIIISATYTTQVANEYIMDRVELKR